MAADEVARASPPEVASAPPAEGAIAEQAGSVPARPEPKATSSTCDTSHRLYDNGDAHTSIGLTSVGCVIE